MLDTNVYKCCVGYSRVKYSLSWQPGIVTIYIVLYVLLLYTCNILLKIYDDTYEAVAFLIYFTSYVLLLLLKSKIEENTAVQ